jgi:hypothetical protein
MRPWRDVLKATVIVTLGAIFVLVGTLVWTLLFFRKPSSIRSRPFEFFSRATAPAASRRNAGNMGRNKTGSTCADHFGTKSEALTGM